MNQSEDNMREIVREEINEQAQLWLQSQSITVNESAKEIARPQRDDANIGLDEVAISEALE